jgi:hypothetical protein
MLSGRYRAVPTACERGPRLLAMAVAAASACTGNDVTWVEPVYGPTPTPPSASEARSDGGSAAARPAGAGQLRALALTTLDAPTLSLPVPGCQFASPIAHGDGFLTAAADQLRSFSSDGSLRWARTLPAPDGERALVVATPIVLGAELFVSYHTIAAGAAIEVNTTRRSQRVIALAAASGETLPAYEPIVLEHDFTSADGQVISFEPIMR